VTPTNPLRYLGKETVRGSGTAKPVSGAAANQSATLLLEFQSPGNALAKLRVSFGKVIYHALLDRLVRLA
jgi:hypothetical protein